MPLQPRDKVVPVRFTKDEHRAMKRAAREAGLRLGEYIRLAVEFHQTAQTVRALEKGMR